MAWTDPDPDRLAVAIRLAAGLHQTQVRKGTSIPYVSHLLSVSALVAEDGGDEDEVIAGLLHDAAEDQGGEAALKQVRGLLGDRIAGLVRECSDSLTSAHEQKAPWRERKERAIERLGVCSEGALRIIAADKLHNTRATLADLALIGDSVWARFKTGREGFLWYHDRVLEELVRRLPNSRSVALLAMELQRLQDLDADDHGLERNIHE